MGRQGRAHRGYPETLVGRNRSHADEHILTAAGVKAVLAGLRSNVENRWRAVYEDRRRQSASAQQSGSSDRRRGKRSGTLRLDKSMPGRTSADHDRRAARLGAGWASLARDLERRLRAIDPSAVAVPRIDSTGLLRFDVRSRRTFRKECATIAANHEEKAVETCELCGGAGRPRAGVIVTVRCAQCAEPH